MLHVAASRHGYERRGVLHGVEELIVLITGIPLLRMLHACSKGRIFLNIYTDIKINEQISQEENAQFIRPSQAFVAVILQATRGQDVP